MITGFTFHLKFSDARTSWEFLQGSGGLHGAGSLAALNSPTCTPATAIRIFNAVLCKARQELAAEGQVRTYREHNDPDKRIVVMYPTEILGADVMYKFSDILLPEPIIFERVVKALPQLCVKADINHTLDYKGFLAVMSDHDSRCSVVDLTLEIVKAAIADGWPTSEVNNLLLTLSGSVQEVRELDTILYWPHINCK